MQVVLYPFQAVFCIGTAIIIHFGVVWCANTARGKGMNANLAFNGTSQLPNRKLFFVRKRERAPGQAFIIIYRQAEEFFTFPTYGIHLGRKLVF